MLKMENNVGGKKSRAHPGQISVLKLADNEKRGDKPILFPDSYSLLLGWPPIHRPVCKGEGGKSYDVRNGTVRQFSPHFSLSHVPS